MPQAKLPLVARMLVSIDRSKPLEQVSKKLPGATPQSLFPFPAFSHAPEPLRLNQGARNHRAH